MEKGFFASLFDLSFTSFITTKLIKIIYAVVMVLLAIGMLVFVIGAFSSGGIGAGLGALIVSPIIFILYVMLTRIWLEMIIVVFRISEDVAKIAASKPDMPQPEL